MTSDKLAALVGVLISLLFAYLPGVKTWIEKQSSELKGGLTAGLTILAGIAIYGLSCAGWFMDLGVICSKAGLQQLVTTIIGALVGLAGTYVTLVRPFKGKP
jgi:hypothetical protein